MTVGHYTHDAVTGKNTGTREHWNVKTEMAAQNIFPPGKRAVASPLYG